MSDEAFKHHLQRAHISIDQLHLDRMREEAWKAQQQQQSQLNALGQSMQNQWTGNGLADLYNQRQLRAECARGTYVPPNSEPQQAPNKLLLLTEE